MENSDRHQRYKYEQQQKFKQFGSGSKKTTLESMMTNMTNVSQKQQHQSQMTFSNQDDFGSFHQAAQTVSTVQQNPQQMPTNNQVQQQNCDGQTQGNWLQNPACIPIVYHQVYEASVASDGLVDTGRVHQILLQSQLSTHVLGHLWSLANIGIPGRLNQQELYLLLGLIALVQSGDSNPNLQKLAQFQAAPIPTFNLNTTTAPPPQQTPPEQEQAPLPRPPQPQQAPILPPNFQPPPYEPPQVVMTSQASNVNNDDDEFGDFAQCNFNSSRNNGIQSPPPPQQQISPATPQISAPTPPQITTAPQIKPTTDVTDDFSDLASPALAKQEEEVVAEDDFCDFAAPATPHIPTPPKDDVLTTNASRNKQAASDVMTSSATLKMENSVDKYAAFKDNDEINLFTSAFAPPPHQQHQVTTETNEEQEATTNEISKNDDFDDDFGDFSEAPLEDFASFADVHQDPVLDPKVKILAEISKSEDQHSVKSLELKNSNKQGESDENGKEEIVEKKRKNLNIVASMNNDVIIPPANDDVNSATFSPPPFDKFDDFDDDEFGDFPSVQPPSMTSSLDADMTSSFGGNSSLATFDAFGGDQVESNEKSIKCDDGRHNHSSLKSHFDLSALSIDKEDDKNNRLRFETDIPEKVELKEAVSPVGDNDAIMTSEDVVANNDEVMVVDNEVEQESVENPTKEETLPTPVYNDVIKSAFSDVTKEATGKRSLKDEEDDFFELWQRCLQACWELLTLANDVFTSIMSPHVCREVVYSCRGQRFIQDLNAVHAVSRRISESYNETFQQGDSRLKVLSTIGKQIDLAWNNILAFCPNTPILETDIKDDESLKSCSICCQQIPTNGNLIEFASSNYHSTCANLWVNNVNSILPSLNH